MSQFQASNPPPRTTPGALHLLSTQIPGFLPSELPDGCPGADLLYDILSSNLLVDAALMYYFSFKLIYLLLQFSSEKSVLELG